MAVGEGVGVAELAAADAEDAGRLVETAETLAAPGAAVEWPALHAATARAAIGMRRTKRCTRNSYQRSLKIVYYRSTAVDNPSLRDRVDAERYVAPRDNSSG